MSVKKKRQAAADLGTACPRSASIPVCAGMTRREAGSKPASTGSTIGRAESKAPLSILCCLCLPMVLSPAPTRRSIACKQVSAPYKAAARGRILRIVSSAFLVVPQEWGIEGVEEERPHWKLVLESWRSGRSWLRQRAGMPRRIHVPLQSLSSPTLSDGRKLFLTPKLPVQ